MERRICKFFQQGTCKKGSSCNFSHEASSGVMTDENIAQQNNTLIPQKLNEPKICKFFLEGNCKHQNCYSIHAYSQHLDHIIFDEDFHSMPIIGICQISK